MLEEDVPDLVWRTDIDGSVRYVNPAVETMLGWTVEEALASSIEDYLTPQSIENSRKWLRRALKSQSKGFSGEFEYVHKDGSIVDGEFNVVIVRDEAGKAVALEGISRDMTERKRIRSALEQSEERFRALTESTSDWIWEVDADGVYTYSSPKVLEMLGYRPEEVVGKTPFDFMSPEEAERIGAEFGAIVKAKEPFSGLENTNRRKDGRLVVLETSGVPILDDKGELLGFRGIDRDISERKQAEERLKAAMDDLERSNNELEMFAYVASHDLQEPLRMISSYVQLLAKRYKDKLDDDANDFIDFAVDGAARMQRLINDLLSYSKLSTHGDPFETVDCNDVLLEAIEGLSLSIEEKAAHVTHDPLPVIKADKSQILRLLHNLIRNAIKFSGAEAPRVHLSAVEDPGAWILSVRDNGIGIEPRFKKKIFTIFRRLHGREYPGTGIGLAVCKKIVERHGGRIWLDSEPGNGTTFHFILSKAPVMEETP